MSESLIVPWKDERGTPTYKVKSGVLPYDSMVLGQRYPYFVSGPGDCLTKTGLPWRVPGLGGKPFISNLAFEAPGKVERKSLSAATFHNCAFPRVVFFECIFRLCAFDRVDFRQAIFVRCDFEGASFLKSTSLAGARFVGCNLSNASMGSLHRDSSVALPREKTHLSSCNISDTRLLKDTNYLTTDGCYAAPLSLFSLLASGFHDKLYSLVVQKDGGDKTKKPPPVVSKSSYGNTARSYTVYPSTPVKPQSKRAFLFCSKGVEAIFKT